MSGAVLVPVPSRFVGELLTMLHRYIAQSRITPGASADQLEDAERLRDALHEAWGAPAGCELDASDDPEEPHLCPNCKKRPARWGAFCNPCEGLEPMTPLEGRTPDCPDCGGSGLIAGLVCATCEPEPPPGETFRERVKRVGLAFP